MKHQGCRDCKHNVWKGGDRVCLYRPYDVQTHDQRLIVEWLKANRDDAFDNPFWTCPKFEDHRGQVHVELDRLKAENEALREALRWYVENDDVNEGGHWEETNEFWLQGKRRALKLLDQGQE